MLPRVSEGSLLRRTGRSARFFVAGVAILAGLFGWVATSPRFLVHINWDAGSYIHQIANGAVAWSSAPWNPHYGMQYMYMVFFWVARLAGGTCIDGARLLGAFCLAAIAALLADAGHRIAGSRLVAALVVALWASAFVTQFLVFTLEDNLVFLAPAAGVLWLCALRAEQWGARESLVAGLLAAAAALMSTQGVLYVLPPLYVGVVLRGRGTSAILRARDAGITLLAMLGGEIGFACLVSGTSALPLRQALAVLLSRPTTSSLPQSATEAIRLLADVAGSLRNLGLAASLQLFSNRIPFASSFALVGIGGFVLLVEIVVLVAATLWSFRQRRWGPHLFATSLLLFSVLTALYRDVPYAYLKRTDFVPLLAAFLLLTSADALFGSTRLRKIAVFALALLIAAQGFAAWRWRRAEAASYATLDETVLGRRIPGYHGVPGEGSFFRHFRALRQANPSACAFVFDVSEVEHGRWNPDITASIWSELPAHYIMGNPAQMSTWPRRMRVLDPQSAGKVLSGCEWISPAAQRSLAARR
ncbi:MAG: hypothetical protein WCG85_09835 [Polyangia bacterium]